VGTGADGESILREIQSNDTLRNEILGTNGTIKWKDFPSQVKGKALRRFNFELFKF
jgi:hypothetical protein